MESFLNTQTFGKIETQMLSDLQQRAIMVSNMGMSSANYNMVICMKLRRSLFPQHQRPVAKVEGCNMLTLTNHPVLNLQVCTQMDGRHYQRREGPHIFVEKKLQIVSP